MYLSTSVLRRKKHLILKMLIAAVFAITILSYSKGVESQDTEKFVCANFSCTQASVVEQPVQYDSLELCRLICGRFGNLWPRPTASMELGRMAMVIDPSKIKIQLSDGTPETISYLKTVSRMFLERLKIGCDDTRDTTTRTTVSIKVRERTTVLDSQTEESYKLEVTSQGRNIDVEIDANTIYGARHGLETLLQLTARRMTKTRCMVLLLTKAVIKDVPIFRHRGLLLDTSRNFLTVRDIERTLDGMGAVKLNVLHWHVTDSHSFPLYLEKVPQMAETGAYSKEMMYSVADQEHLIEYGRLRGVRIVVEIDSPGHAGNGWGWGPEAGLGNLVLCSNADPWRSFCVQPPCGQLNPANQAIYHVLREMFSEIGSRFTAHDYFHMGGDEVYLPCWNSSKEVQEFMKNSGYDLSIESYKLLWADFHKKALQAWDSAVGHNRTKILLWTSDLTEPTEVTRYLDPARYTIEAWTDAVDSTPNQLAQLGYDVIYATRDAWYLDHGFWGTTQYHSWKTVYNNIIPTGPRVLGGEAAMWSELADSQNLDVKIWPRAAALAERLWSNPTVLQRGSDTEQVEYRLANMRELLIRLGIEVDAIMPHWCYLNQDRCK